MMIKYNCVKRRLVIYLPRTITNGNLVIIDVNFNEPPPHIAEENFLIDPFNYPKPTCSYKINIRTECK